MKKYIILFLLCGIFLIICAKFTESEKWNFDKEDFIYDKTQDITDTLKEQNDPLSKKIYDFLDYASDESSVREIPDDAFPLQRSVYNPTYKIMYNNSTDIGVHIPDGWELLTNGEMLYRFDYPDIPAGELEKYDYTDFYNIFDIPDFVIENRQTLQYTAVYFLNPSCREMPAYTNAEEFSDYLVEFELNNAAVSSKKGENYTIGEYTFMSVVSERILDRKPNSLIQTLFTQISDEYIMVLQNAAFADTTDIVDIVPKIFCGLDGLNFANINDYEPNKNFEICYSLYDSVQSLIYNPYFDYGFALPFGWQPVKDGYLIQDIQSMTPAKISSYADTSLYDVAVIEDYSAVFHQNSTRYTMNVYVHNLVLDNYFGDANSVTDDSCLKSNMDFLAENGYTNINRGEDLLVGNDLYKQAYGDLYQHGYFQNRCIILSHIINDNYAVRFEIFCYDKLQHNFIFEKIFNSENNPDFASLITNKIGRAQQDIYTPPKEPTKIVRWISVQDKTIVNIINIFILLICSVISYILTQIVARLYEKDFSSYTKRKLTNTVFGFILMILVVTLMFCAMGIDSL